MNDWISRRIRRGPVTRRRSACALLALCLAPAPLSALGLAAGFGNHMVLQRDRELVIRGSATAGASIELSFGDHRVSTTTASDGRWQVTLPAMPASTDGRELVVRGDGETLRFEDVLVGEVWLCSGQSNMEKPLGEKRGQRPTDHHLGEIAAADHPTLRLFQVPHHGKVSKPDAQQCWLPCTSESVVASEFSAVGYFFGREILHALDVPVGIIHASFGGTMIEAWMPRETVEGELPELLDREYFAWVEGVQVTELWQSMLAPLTGYPLRGFLWYQGEANAMNGESTEYTGKMAALVSGWRSAWQLPEAPFYFVQLAPFEYSAWDSIPAWLTPQGLPLFRDAQTAALEVIPRSGMVVTTDLGGDGSDIHPTNKRDVGLRLAHLALRETYGDSRRHAHGPRFAAVDFTADGRALVRFSQAGKRLMRSDAEPLSGFELAGANREFHPATARIVDNDRIEVSCARVGKPVAVRFAWHETATPNLVNAAGLPAVPFRSDDWPVANTREKPPVPPTE